MPACPSILEKELKTPSRRLNLDQRRRKKENSPSPQLTRLPGQDYRPKSLLKWAVFETQYKDILDRGL